MTVLFVSEAAASMTFNQVGRIGTAIIYYVSAWSTVCAESCPVGRLAGSALARLPKGATLEGISNETYTYPISLCHA
jgi:hypothetical protein